MQPFSAGGDRGRVSADTTGCGRERPVRSPNDAGTAPAHLVATSTPTFSRGTGGWSRLLRRCDGSLVHLAEPATLTVHSRRDCRAWWARERRPRRLGPPPRRRTPRALLGPVDDGGRGWRRRLSAGHGLGRQFVRFHPTPNTTRGEARSIGDLAERYGWTSIIIITTRDHAWRASLRVSRCFDGEIYVSPSPLSIAGWIQGVPYQIIATVKAMTYERSC